MHEETKEKNLNSFPDVRFPDVDISNYKGCCVEIHKDDISWLKDYYEKNLPAGKVKLFKKRFLIKVKLNSKSSIYLLVREFKNDNFFQVDTYLPNNLTKSYLGLTASNEPIENTEIQISSLNWMFAEQIAYISMYCILYMSINIDKTERVEYTSNEKKSSKKGSSKKRTKKVERVIYLPKKIYCKTQESAEETESTQYEADYSVNELERDLQVISDDGVTEEANFRMDNSDTESNSNDTEKIADGSDTKRTYCGFTPEWESSGYYTERTLRNGKLWKGFVKGSTKKRNPALLKKGEEEKISYIPQKPKLD